MARGSSRRMLGERAWLMAAGLLAVAAPYEALEAGAIAPPGASGPGGGGTGLAMGASSPPPLGASADTAAIEGDRIGSGGVPLVTASRAAGDPAPCICPSCGISRMLRSPAISVPPIDRAEDLSRRTRPPQAQVAGTSPPSSPAPAPVPEPATLGVFALGVLGYAWLRRRSPRPAPIAR
jgi:hypothetical protein